MTKSDKKFSKSLRHQIEAITAGTRFTLDAKTGTVTPDDTKTGKKHKAKTADAEADDGKKN